MDVRMSVSAARGGCCLFIQSKLNKPPPYGSHYSCARETTHQSSSNIKAMLMNVGVSLARA